MVRALAGGSDVNTARVVPNLQSLVSIISERGCGCGSSATEDHCTYQWAGCADRLRRQDQITAAFIHEARLVRQGRRFNWGC